MRIVHLITALETGGAETMLAKLLASMDRSAFEPLVVSMVPPGDLGERIRANGVEVVDLNMRRGLPSPWALRRFIALLRARRPQVVQTWLYHADLLGLAAVRSGFPLGGRPALAWNLRCAFMDFSQYRRATAWTVRLCARLSGLPDAIAANSRSAVDRHIALGYSPRRFEVIPNGFDAEMFRPRPEARDALRRELGIPLDSPLVGMAARFDPMKDYRTFLRAAGLVAAHRADVHFVCCGSGITPENTSLIHAAKQARLGNRLHLLGQRVDVASILAALDICVSSSQGESFPNVLGEALCCGVPCLATDVGDSASIVGRCGDVVRPGDADSLARAMLRLLELPAQERELLGEEGRSRMIREYSMESVAERYARFYMSLAGAKHSAKSPAMGTGLEPQGRTDGDVVFPDVSADTGAVIGADSGEDAILADTDMDDKEDMEDGAPVIFNAPSDISENSILHEEDKDTFGLEYLGSDDPVCTDSVREGAIPDDEDAASATSDGFIKIPSNEKISGQ